MFIQGDGNVGIGTTAPGAKLEIGGGVTGADPAPVLKFSNYYDNSGTPPAISHIALYDEGLTSSERYGFGISGGVLNMFSSQDFVFNEVIAGGAMSEWMRIKSGGNVGIGNTSPLAALDVTGSASLSANLSLRGNATAHTFDILDNGSLNFRKSPGGSGQTTSLFIQGDGNVGIGTTGPNAKLHITGTSGGGYTTTNKLIMQRTEATNPTAMIEFQGSGGGSGTRWQITSDADVTNDFGISYGGTKYLQVLSGGNVGIGTTAPSSFILQTAGSIGPNATASYDLGSPTLAWRNIYSGTSGISGYIQRNAQALSPTNITDDFLIGGTATSSAIIRLAGTNVGGANLLDVFNSGT
ncbi:MAG: hypothetical protein UY42_C0032G0001, partial [Parcubacteria group bacterium GW2011_GWA2_49_16]